MVDTNGVELTWRFLNRKSSRRDSAASLLLILEGSAHRMLVVVGHQSLRCPTCFIHTASSTCKSKSSVSVMVSAGVASACGGERGLPWLVMNKGEHQHYQGHAFVLLCSNRRHRFELSPNTVQQASLGPGMCRAQRQESMEPFELPRLWGLKP